ncbi:CRISPR-associated helicase/endonuclease Cas3 [Carboxydocella sp. ULO1]|uniref:CRISPR-associated helicase/endonuclease Cas3 n=1 Tax=Carboxydocella sp. ULO1 TaxID=1926599 RepID=UPI0009AC2D68|nr:CRISPR-associated helicase/endonuclease Cas3 [Carboxydocella sp. ULO1]GAW29841.1 CRISPR-associated helicase/endonuclease Cas3 [Carboxydocella sp. ULO1]
MVSALPSSDLYSHPDTLLEDHLLGTARAVETFLAEKEQQLLPAEVLLFLAKTIALLHDIGKATPYFQEYLFASEQEKKGMKELKEKNHGLFSAVVAYYAVKEGMHNLLCSEEDKWCLPIVAFLAVKRHHGNLQNAIDELFIEDEELKILRNQAESLDEEKFARLVAHLQKGGLTIPLSKNLILGWMTEDLCREFLRLRRRLRNSGSTELYLQMNKIYSLLIDGDKSNVVLTTTFSRPELNTSPEFVDRFKEKKISPAPTAINNLRQQAYREALEQEIDLAQKIYSLNLPTGMGKTLTSLAFAFKLRAEIQQKTGVIPRIIYSLPFISIIEQNADVVEQVLVANGINPETSVLLKHHHLADYTYFYGEEEQEPDTAKILIEGWNSEIIVTTFVQLFHTLVSNRNVQLRKFHRLANSIIILDEIQAIPARYWLLLRELLREITEKLRVYVIFCTATEPFIVPREEIKALVERKKYFDKLERVTLKTRLEEEMTLEEWLLGLELKSDKSYLFVLNTINCARRFYQMLQEKYNLHNEITFLSAHVIPRHRLERIREIKEGKKRIAVTTQLVEAGVDIDFDVVYRDLAPLDCINQTAGRCNREGRKKGKVIVVKLRDERRKYASYIYDQVLLRATEEILKEEKEISESRFLHLVEKYFSLVEERKSAEDSRKLLNALQSLFYDSSDSTEGNKIPVSAFSLIENDIPRVSVFVEWDEEAAEIWEKYKRLKEIPNVWERRLEFNRFKSKFYQYVVNIPKKSKNLPPFDYGFGYVGRSNLEEYYDTETGFKCEGELALW